MLNKKFFLILVFIFVSGALVSGCGEKVKQEDVIVKVNGYIVTSQDFASEMQYAPRDVYGKVDKNKILDLIIKKQVLIQEAQKQGLDRKPSFMRAIERYWQQTLIKELLDTETKRISLTEKDVAKREKVLTEWVDGLCKKSDIKINPKNLEKM
ncbi:MAG: hypothetical protein PHW46_04845 [Candidatus Omnitrophica bacterium]|nr:hypothetical protein [Candidatus Omnitrophota bacterium]